MSHQGSISLYQPNDSIAYSPWVPQEAQLKWLKQEYHRYNGDSPALVLSPQFVTLIHSQLLNNWPSMNLDCTPQDIQLWWETERVVRRFNILNYPTSGVNVPPLAAQWNQPVNATDVYSPPYPSIPAPLNQTAPQSVTFTQFHNQHSNLGHYIPPLLHDMLPNQQQHPGSLVPFHTVMPDVPNYQLTPHQAEVGNTRAATPASETIPGLDGPPPLSNEPPATQPDKSKKLKVGDAQLQLPSDCDITNRRTMHKAAHLWSKSESNDVDFGAQADQELMERNLSANNRLATLNRLVIAAWDLLNEEEQRPWIDQAVEILSAEPSLVKKNKKAIKKFDRTAQAVLDEYASWSFYVLWGENDAKFGQTAIRGNSPAGDNFQTWFKTTYPDESGQFMDRLGEYLDYVMDQLNQKQLRSKSGDNVDEVGIVAAVNGQLPRAVRDLLNLDYEELNVHDLRKRAHTIFVGLWRAAGWTSQKVPWTKIRENPQKYCNKSFLPNWWLFANPAGSNANKETLKKMLKYLKNGSEGLLPTGHSFRFHPRDSSLAMHEDTTNEDDTPTTAAYNGGPSTSTVVPTIMNAANANASPAPTPAPPNTTPTLTNATNANANATPAPTNIADDATENNAQEQDPNYKQNATFATTTTTTAPAPDIAATTTNFPTPHSIPSTVDPLPATAHSPTHPPLPDPNNNDNADNNTAHDSVDNLEDPIWPPPMTEEYLRSEAGKREELRRLQHGLTAPGQRMASPPPPKPACKGGMASTKPYPVMRQSKPKKDKVGSGVADSLRHGVAPRRSARKKQEAIEPTAIEVPTSPGNAKRTIEDVFESDQALGEPATTSHLTRNRGRKRSKPE